MRIVLASESPFRKQAMDMLRIAYEICPAAIDEKAIRHDDPAVLTRTLCAPNKKLLSAKFAKQSAKLAKKIL
jgi:predicted house-cleaning NTP pyrophosphatase (Maf/HAM1 superfamily)